MKQPRPPWLKAVLDPAKEERLQQRRLNRVIEMLAEAPDAPLAIMSTNEVTPGRLTMTIAIRGLAAFEMDAPLEKCDGWKLMELITRYGGEVGDE